MNSKYGWHWLNTTLRDGSPIPHDYVWLHPLKNLVLCERAYHGSENSFDALKYAPGSLLTYCEYRGEFMREDDKFGASERRILCRMDATEMLYHFARMQAVSVVHEWNAPEVVLDYLVTGEADLRSAARSAAESAARSAAESATRSATWSAARSAAESAARTNFNEFVFECFESVVNPDGSHK